MNDNIYNEIINKGVNDLGFKNPQYDSHFYNLFWEKYLKLFNDNFSHKFTFDYSNKKINERNIYLETKNRATNQKILFILSLPEGQMPTFNNGVLARLNFKNNLFKKYICDFNSIFFITFYAPLKNKIIKNFDNQNIIDSTDFDNTVCLISGLQEIWNTSKKYGERYESILFNKYYSQEEWISLSVKYSKILDFYQNKKMIITKDIIFYQNGNMLNINQNKDKNRVNNINLIKLKDINSSFKLLIDKNNQFIKWAKWKYLGEVNNNYENDQIIQIQQNSEISETEKQALIKSRINQGKFREKIIEEFDCCIFTKISDQRLLIASHIKPWSKSNNKERLDKNNGLLLSPMFDKLFDKGLITFSDNEELIISKDLSKDIINILNIKEGKKYNLKLNKQKKEFIKFHREEIFSN